jgi:nitrite reductase/ring-hydroxylating ferredoxin subunit
MTHETETGEPSTTRRGVLAGTGMLGVAGVLAACGSGGGSSGGGGSSLAKTSEIPVGGGTIFAAQKVVVTQPTKGEFKAFSATCTHMGCTVAKVADGTIDCPCHGSKYKIADGSVAKGPAPKPLPAAQIKVSGGEIKLA